MAFVFVSLLSIAALVGIDQAIKAWAVAVLQPAGTMPFIPYLVDLRFVLNDGMAFSLLSGMQGLLILLTTATLLALVWFLFSHCRKRPLAAFTMILLIGGGIGNLIDRLLNGVVVDYLNLLFMDFAVFNFADVCVTVGVVLLIIGIFWDDKKKNASAKESEPEDGSPSEDA